MIDRIEPCMAHETLRLLRNNNNTLMFFKVIHFLSRKQVIFLKQIAPKQPIYKYKFPLLLFFKTDALCK